MSWSLATSAAAHIPQQTLATAKPTRYSLDGQLVMVSHIVATADARNALQTAFSMSGGLIDYLGDYVYSGPEAGSFDEKLTGLLAAKAADKSININNPVLAVRTPDASLSFFLYIGGRLEPLHELP